MNTSFSKNLAFLIKRDGLTNQSFAEIIGKKGGAIGTYIRGSAQPNLDTIVKIASYFKINLDSLIFKDLSLINLNNHKDEKNVISTLDTMNKEIINKLNIIHSIVSRDQIKNILRELIKEIDEPERP